MSVTFVSTFLIICLLFSLSSTQLSPFCDKSIHDGQIIIDSSALIGHQLLLFTNRTVTVIDVTNDREPIVAFNTFEEYFKGCGKEISLRAPIEVSYALDELKADTHLFIVTKNENIRVWMKDYLPSNCGNWDQNNAELKDSSLLDSFILNTRPADLLKEDGTIIMQWYSDIGHYQRGYLHFNMSSVIKRIALTSTKGESGIGLNELNGQFITTGIVIPKSVNNSFMTTNTLILFASRYSVEVPLELDKWVSLEIKDFSKEICRNDPSRSTATTESTTTPTTTSEVTPETTTQTPTTPSSRSTITTKSTTMSTPSTTIPTTSYKVFTNTTSQTTTTPTSITTLTTTSTTTPSTPIPEREVRTTVSTVETTIPIVGTSVTTTPTTVSTTTLSTQTNHTKPTNSTNETNIWSILFMIVVVIIVVSLSLGIIVFIIYYMNAKSEKREQIQTQSLIFKSSSTETSVKSLSATKSFEPKSSQDYSKPIDLKSSSVTDSSSSSASTVKNRPKGLQVE